MCSDDALARLLQSQYRPAPMIVAHYEFKRRVFAPSDFPAVRPAIQEIPPDQTEPDLSARGAMSSNAPDVT